MVCTRRYDEVRAGKSAHSSREVRCAVGYSQYRPRATELRAVTVETVGETESRTAH